LKNEIEHNKSLLLRTSSESEKQKCREIIARLEKELNQLRTQQNSTQPNPSNSSNVDNEIARLKREIKYNKDYISKTPHEDEKEKCRKIVARLEEQLRKLQTPQSNPSSSSNGSNSDFEEINNKDKGNKDKKVKQLEDEIEQLKKSSEGRWISRQKKADQKKKIEEKEKELSELKKRQ